MGAAPPKGEKPIGEKPKGENSGEVTMGDKGDIGSKETAVLGGGGLSGCTGKDAHQHLHVLAHSGV